MRLFLRRWILAPALLVVAAPLVVWLGLPWPWTLALADPPATSFMAYRTREARRADEPFTPVQDWVPLEEIPEVVVRAVLVSEDDRFREHTGVDWKALGEEVHWSGGDAFSWRKAGEFVVARRLETFLGKDRILEIYLNTAELGPGIFGVGAAARAYFDVPLQRVNRVQAASLAATLPHPLTSNPKTRPGRMAWRRDLILARLSGREVVIPVEPEPLVAPGVELPPPHVEIPGDAGAAVDSVAASPPDTTPAPPDTVPEVRGR